MATFPLALALSHGGERASSGFANYLVDHYHIPNPEMVEGVFVDFDT